MTDEQHLFVGEDLVPRAGTRAREALARTNDARYVDPVRGVIQVPRERWEVAQRYERRTWMEAGTHTTDDRNTEHARCFDGYAALRGQRFARAIELGCGPFTNLRLIAGVCMVSDCVLLDPLIEEYRSHRHCTYRAGRVTVAESELSRRLGATWGGRAMRRLVRGIRPEVLVSGPPVSQMIAAPIEEMPVLDPFDLVVMINVLEHCFDVGTVFSRVGGLCRPGTVFVFHDKLYDAAQVRQHARVRYDAGHPLRVDGSLIRGFLDFLFQPRFERCLDVTDRFAGIDLDERGIYFIGERRAGDTAAGTAARSSAGVED